MPHWLQGDVLDVRLAVNYWLGMQASQTPDSLVSLPLFASVGPAN